MHTRNSKKISVPYIHTQRSKSMIAFLWISGRFFCKLSARLLLEGITFFIMGC